jgi:hypothetical protein
MKGAENFMQHRINPPERLDWGGLGNDSGTGRLTVATARKVCAGATREGLLVCLDAPSHPAGRRILAPHRVSRALMPTKEKGPRLAGAVGSPATQDATV